MRKLGHLATSRPDGILLLCAALYVCLCVNVSMCICVCVLCHYMRVANERASESEIYFEKLPSISRGDFRVDGEACESQ